MAEYVGAIDQGTTSTRFIIFNRQGEIVATAQKEHAQIYPRPGWVEHDPAEIWANTQEVISGALGKAGITKDELAAVGITNQRETALIWDRTSGEPLQNAIVWMDTRTDQMVGRLAADGGQDRFRAQTGLPLATYFSGPKVAWLLENQAGLSERAQAGEFAFGTLDTWLVWNLTGGVSGGVHITDVTNASRTLLMDLETLSWDAGIAATIGVPLALLPEIRSSSEVYGDGVGVLEGVPIAGILGDQQAALFGQTCFDQGDAKNTYGTGSFLLMNTGETPIASTAGLLTTVAYQLGEAAPVYALEGSIAITGALVQWLRDNLRMIDSAEEIEALAATVDDNGGAYFVPAFSGLYAPHWRSDARGVIVGLTRYVNRGHIARAALEATAYQTKEVVEAMRADTGIEPSSLKVDGGMVVNEVLMQFQADILDLDVIRPRVVETTCLGAAYAAGLAVGFWKAIDDLRANWGEDKRWTSKMEVETRDRGYKQWNKAVERTLGWTTE